MNTCSYCSSSFSTNQSLKRHYSTCKEKQKQLKYQQQKQYQEQLEQQQKQYQEQLEQQQKQYQEQLEQQQKQYQEQLEKQLEEQREQKAQYEKRIEKLEDKLFEIAKQPKNITTNNTTTTQTNNSRNTAIINQLAPYDLTKDQITQLFYQHFNLNTFHGGPEEIAKLTAQVILTNPESQKPKVTCTDISRKNFKYVDEEQAVQVDPGFQKTHDLIKEPLSQANVRMYVDELKCDDRYRDQWRKNEDFISDRTGFSDKMLKWM
jgi:DNA segregation ATPase FtsK/SpoIIIE-like protein